MLYGKQFKKILKLELYDYCRYPGQWMNSILFFTLIVIMFPLMTSVQNSILIHFIPAIFGLISTLSVILSLNYLFNSDYEDGTLDLYILSFGTLKPYVAIKLITHWMIFCLPILVISPILFVLYNIEYHLIGIILLSLLFSTTILLILGALISGLILSIKNQGLLLILLILPIFAPVLIFCSGTINAALTNDNYLAPLLFLFSILMFTIITVPSITSFFLKVSLD